MKTKSQVCTCSIYYDKKSGLITVGRPHGTRFYFRPENFIKTFDLIIHETRQLTKLQESSQ